MNKIIKKKDIRNLMTVATNVKYMFFSDSILYKRYYCLYSIAKAEEAITSLNIKMGQLVITSPMVGREVFSEQCIVYKAINLDVDNGLLVPIVSWAIEMTEWIRNLDTPICITNSDGLLEMLLLQVCQYENINISNKGLIIDLQNCGSCKSMFGNSICWYNYDSLVRAESLLENGVISSHDEVLLHAHLENIDYFYKADIKKGVIFDW